MNATIDRIDNIDELIAVPTISPRGPLARALEFVGVAGLGAIAYIHLLDVKSKFAEVPYLGVGYVALIVASLASMVFLVRGDKRGWVLGGLTAAATFAGFCLSRTVGLPGSTDDIGNWGEMLGIYSLIAEAGVVALAVNALRRRD